MIKLLMAVGALLFTVLFSVADAPMPFALRANYAGDGCVNFLVPASANVEIRVIGGYDNISEGRSITLQWLIQHGTARKKLVELDIPVAFRPLAMTPRCGTTDKLYVAGWQERADGKLLIESWTLVPPASVGSVINPVTGDEETISTNPHVQRSSALAVSENWPIWAMVCEPFGTTDRLLMLKYFEPSAAPANGEIWEYDVGAQEFVDHDGDGSPDPMATPVSNPTLSSARDLFPVFIPNLGFAAITAPRPKWSHGFNDDEWIVFLDTDLNGSPDIDFPLDPAVFLAEHPYESWDGEYAP
jgi:hypothetical protein